MLFNMYDMRFWDTYVAQVNLPVVGIPQIIMVTLV